MVAQRQPLHVDAPVELPPVSHTLRLAFLLTLVILLVEGIGGLLAHSLALLADAGHVLTDLAALGLAWWAVTQARRPADSQRTFGYYRVGILAALANALTLFVVVGVIAFEAVQRIGRPEAIVVGPMFLSAGIGAAINTFIALRLHTAGGATLNLRAALAHVLGDVGASLAVIVGAGLILLTGWTLIDPLLSLLIALLVAHSAWGVLRDAINILLEAVPPDVDLAAVAQDILSVSGVCDVHDLHVWTLGDERRALSAHVLVRDCPVSACAPLIEQVAARLRDHYRIDHPTIQCEVCGEESALTPLVAAAPSGAYMS